jgi:hypothetical protein
MLVLQIRFWNRSVLVLFVGGKVPEVCGTEIEMEVFVVEENGCKVGDH